MVRRFSFWVMMGCSVAGLSWLALRPNPQVSAFLWSSASVAHLVGLDPAWVIDTPGNIVVFIPIGATLALIGRRGASAQRLLMGAVGGLLLSVTLELLQTLTPTRVPSARDVLLNTLGATSGAGIAVWAAPRVAGRKHRAAR